MLKFAVYDWTARHADSGTANVEYQFELPVFELQAIRALS